MLLRAASVISTGTLCSATSSIASSGRCLPSIASSTANLHRRTLLVSRCRTPRQHVCQLFRCDHDVQVVYDVAVGHEGNDADDLALAVADEEAGCAAHVDAFEAVALPELCMQTHEKPRDLVATEDGLTRCGYLTAAVRKMRDVEREDRPQFAL